MRDINKELKECQPHNLGMEIILSDLDGNIEKHIQGGSLLVQYIGLMCAQVTEITDTTTTKNTGGTSSTTAKSGDNFRVANDDNNTGIFLGTSNQAVAIDDFKLISPIADGVGAGQLNYQTHSIDSNITSNGTDAYYDLSRGIANNSGNSISVEEVALYQSVGSLTTYRCTDRSLFSFSFPNGVTKVVTYRFKVTV